MIKTTINVEGMACGNCEARVNSALEKAFTVSKVKSDHEKNITEVFSEDELDEAKVRSVIEGEGFKVTGMKSEQAKRGLFSWK
ncbi:MAG: heavy-metal-associated domain-containing protein [Victivallales bacterium]|nr:heavy-metal-associated domain-containing protein [Victivallales bacterium]